MDNHMDDIYNGPTAWQQSRRKADSARRFQRSTLWRARSPSLRAPSRSFFEAIVCVPFQVQGVNPDLSAVESASPVSHRPA